MHRPQFTAAVDLSPPPPQAMAFVQSLDSGRSLDRLLPYITVFARVSPKQKVNVETHSIDSVSLKSLSLSLSPGDSGDLLPSPWLPHSDVR